MRQAKLASGTIAASYLVKSEGATFFIPGITL